MKSLARVGESSQKGRGKLLPKIICLCLQSVISFVEKADDPELMNYVKKVLESMVSDVVPRISSRRQSWDTKIGGVGLLGVLDQRRGAVVGDLHQLRYFRAFVEIRTQNYEIRTQNRL